MARKESGICHQSSENEDAEVRCVLSLRDVGLPLSVQLLKEAL